MDEEDRDPRPSCNCRTSNCVRRYCPCFGRGWYCSAACRCEPCVNTEAREALVEERAEMCLSKGRSGAAASQQSKGCTCRKSECRKNYCDCFKNRAACTERCKCEGCANPHGAKKGRGGGAVLPHNNGGTSSGGDSDGKPNGGSGTLGGGSDGTFNETAGVTGEGPVSPTEAELQENLAAFLELSDIGQHVCAPSFLFNPLAVQDCFSQNVHTLMNQGSAQALLHASAKSTPQYLLDPNVNSGNQKGPSEN